MHRRVKKLLIIGITGLAILILLDLFLFLAERGNPSSTIQSFENAVWYTLVTLTSVGYGDYTPHTFIGKSIGYLFVLSSVFVLGTFISSMSSIIMNMIQENKLGYRGTNFTNHIVCIGWNDFSKMVVHELTAADRQVAIITNNKEEVDMIYEEFGKANMFVLYADLNNLEAISKANPNDSATVFFAFRDDTESLIYSINFKKKFPKPNLVVSISDHRLTDTFIAAGVAHVVARNVIASKLVASYVFEPDVADLNIDLMGAATHADDFDNQQYLVTENNPFLNKNYDDAFVSLKLKYNIVLLGIVKKVNNVSKLHVNARSETMIENGDYLIIMVAGKSKARVVKLFGIKEGKKCCDN